MRYSDISPIGDPDAKDLAVIVHGYSRGVSVLEDLRRATQEVLPEAALLVPSYPGGVFSNEDPADIAGAILDMIDAADSEREASYGEPYRRIVLIGYSLGALLVRKVYVFARAQAQDAAGGFQREERPWAHRVERIVLLAGMNRGWSLRPKPENMSWLRAIGLRLAAGVSRLLGRGYLIRRLQRGSPFVTNLRIQWLELARSAAPPPLTIQLLGDRDDVVSAFDSVDIQSGRDFVTARFRTQATVTSWISVGRWEVAGERSSRRSSPPRPRSSSAGANPSLR